MKIKTFLLAFPFFFLILLLASFIFEAFQPRPRINQAGDAYVNVYTKEYPEGEIRGQIMPGMKQGFHEKISGRSMTS